MIKNLRVCHYSNGDLVAQFETRAEDDAYKGQRVKHYVYQDVDSRGFWHERHYLDYNPEHGPVHTFTLDVSDRVFFGKARLVRYRDACLSETWAAVVEAIKAIERIKMRESHD